MSTKDERAALLAARRVRLREKSNTGNSAYPATKHSRDNTRILMAFKHYAYIDLFASLTGFTRTWTLQWILAGYLAPRYNTDRYELITTPSERRYRLPSMHKRNYRINIGSRLLETLRILSVSDYDDTPVADLVAMYIEQAIEERILTPMTGNYYRGRHLDMECTCESEHRPGRHCPVD